MTILVTGATGFVGSAVARQLVSRDEDVRVLVRAGGDRRNIADLPVQPVEGDLRDGASLQRALRGCRALYHVAADYRIWVPRPDEIYETNVAGTTRLLRAAAAEGVERIVYTSSVAVLGARPDGAPADEATPVRLADMIGHYKRSKFLAEEAVRRLVRDEGLPVVIVNPSTPIGPHDVKPTPTGRLIVEAATGRMPAFVDTGLNVVHVDDVAAGHRHGPRATAGAFVVDRMLGGRETANPRAGHPAQALAVRGIGRQHRVLRLPEILEQRGLGLEVGCLRLVKVEMVTRQVQERRRGESRALDT